MTKRKDHPTKEEVAELGEMLRKMGERQSEEWGKVAEFKPGELTPEDQELVKREGLDALNYIPQSTLRKQADALRSPRRSSSDLVDQLRDRFDGYGYGMFLFLILAFTWAIVSAHGWPIGIFCCLLMLTVLKLSYRLSTRH